MNISYFKGLVESLMESLTAKISSVIVGLFLCSVQAHALSFTITNQNIVDPAYTAVITPLITQFENYVNNTLAPDGDVTPILGAMSNAGAASTRGLGFGRPDNWDYVSVSLSVGVGVEAGSLSNIGSQQNSLPQIGFGAQSALTVGLPSKLFGIGDNLLGMDTSRLKFYGDFMVLPLHNIYKGLDLDFVTVGLHADYQIIPTKGHWFARWTGVQIGTGLDYSHLSATYHTPLNFSQTSSGVTMNYDSNVDVGVSSNIVSLPIQAQTGATLLHFLTVYLGLGVDLNVGSTNFTGGVTGPVTATALGSTVFTGTGVLDLGAPSGVSPSFLDARAFAGFQINVAYIHLFVQATKVTQSTESVLLGLNVAI